MTSGEYLMARGWTLCTDVTHDHPEAGQGTLLHPPSGSPGTWAPAQLTTYEEAVARGLAGLRP